MNKEITIMRTKYFAFAVLAVLALVLSACGPTTINQAAPENLRTVNVNGLGVVYLTPNIAYINVMLKVGYIGLGLMGKSIARNILKAGFPLVVHNRSRAAVAELVAEGATEAFSPAEVAGRWMWFSPTCQILPMWKGGARPRRASRSAHPGLVFVDN
jgi:hypothetical protein